MGRFLSGFVLPMLLLTAALVNWSLMSMADLLAFLFVQYTAPKIGARSRRRSMASWYILCFSSLVIFSQAIFHIVCAIKGDQWSTADAQWAKLIGFLSSHSSRSTYATYFLVIQVLTVAVAAIEIYENRFYWDYPWLKKLYSYIRHIGLSLWVL
ncbi:hypothetical protein Tsubulata_035435 [Turnera subulata]|uniref:Piezo non-specific cation channel R-Ras-binding domain-containing protein n=1 Tax=Turnera subulata TaxID=218843 RepID=A0A9Q0FR38_9ROSI|nr:hypothetical protein Tsubulata_035435 [Turnera subulata]